MSRSTNHKAYLLERLLSCEALTASKVTQISNSNQYFVELENEGLISSEWGTLGDSRVKWRFIEPAQREKAEATLKRLRG